MKKILIISPDMTEQELFQSAAQAHRPGEYTVETTGSFGQDTQFWTTQAPDVLVLRLPEDKELQSHYFTKLKKDVKKNQGLIFLCPVISPELMRFSQVFAKVRMMKTPVEKNQILRAVIDLTANFEDGKRQISPRYLTDQPVEVRSDLHEGKVSAVMKNLSVTGVYFETLEDGFEIKPQDFIRLSIYTGQPVKLYVFDVRIVWARDKEGGFKCYGCTFVNKDEVYNNLLKHL